MDQLQTIAIPSDLCRRAGIAAAAIPIDQLCVFPHQPARPPRADRPSAFASGAPTRLFHLRADLLLARPALRKLVNEANGVFLDAQRLAALAAGDARRAAAALACSRAYRSVVRACLEGLQEGAARLGADELRDQVTILYTVECVWHLCEILFLGAAAGGAVLPHLLDWVQFHCPKFERRAAELLAGGVGGIEGSGEYWETVIGSFLQGRVKVVRTLLRLHSDSDSVPFRLVEQNLKSMPVYSAFSGVSAIEFDVQHRQWVADIQQQVEAKAFISCYNLNLLMKLCTGDENAWSEIHQYCETWYELLAAELFFTQPTVKTFELGRFAKDALNKMCPKSQIRHLDRLLLATMDFDILQVIKLVQNMTDNGWFATHLTDLFYHSGKLSDLNFGAEQFSAEKLRESFLIDYGTLLMSHHSLWQVGLNYLDHCPENGTELIKLLLVRLPCDSEMRALKVLYEAKLRNLDDTAQHVCKVQGIKFRNCGRLGHALTWALKSRDCGFITQLADAFLRKYAEDGVLVDADLLDSLGQSILASDRLVFLGKYFEFQKVFRLGNYLDAANLLIALLESKLVPEYFWHILLKDALSLLECRDCVFSSVDTFIILQCLDDREDDEQMESTNGLLRLGAARNLARALINETQS